MAAYNNRDNNRSTNPFEDDLDEYEFDTALSKLEQTQNRILGSTSRSLGMIEESHNIAIKTAEELQRQEEVLLRTDKDLDEMRQNMSSANRHIRSVKSVWGAIGNYFSKPSVVEAKPEPSQAPPEKPLNIETDLQLNYGQEDYFSQYGGGRSGRGTDAFERRYNNHLDEISRGVSILKDDATVLGTTIDRHDDIITRVQGKVELVDDEVKDADRRVKRILRR